MNSEIRGKAMPASPHESAGVNGGSERLLRSLVVTLFFAWGFATVLVDSLIPKLKGLFQLSYFDAMLTQFCFFIAYFLFSMPMSALLARIGYGRAVASGLAIMAAGCVLFSPAAVVGSYSAFLLALFVMAAGITMLQVAANPLMALLGDPTRSHSRLNLAQAFNSLGTTVGPLVGAVFILGGGIVNSKIGDANAEAPAAIRDAQAHALQIPFLGIALGLVVIAVAFWVLRNRTRLPTATSSQPAIGLLRRPRIALGAAALFLYVGAEVSVGSIMVNYLMQPRTLGVAAVEAGRLVSLYWGGAMVGRFLGSVALRRLRAGNALAACALAAASLAFASVISTGVLSAAAIIAIGLCNSIMFPTIFSLAIEGLDEDASRASGLLCMAIVGGAVIPPLAGLIADRFGLAAALSAPFACYLAIAAYGRFTARRPAAVGAGVLLDPAVGSVVGLAVLVLIGTGAVQASAQEAASASGAWMNVTLSADARADLLEKAMTQDERVRLVHGSMPMLMKNRPADVVGSGYVPGIPRLGVPALRETDASLGVAAVTHKLEATALPSGLAVASSWDPDIAYRSGAMVGGEAAKKGFNVLLGGGVNLAREPRCGRNFEYLGEDPLLAGTLAGQAIRGTQDQGIVSTVKHYALNDQETGRRVLDAQIDPAALRESDLLAFEIAIERGDPGSVMCSYNKVNGPYACASADLLQHTLKGDWHYPGWVMSDWGAVRDAKAAVEAGLDQQSGEELDKMLYKQAVEQVVGQDPDRLHDMVHRILRTMFARGLFDHSAAPGPIDFEADAQVALKAEEAGIVLLKNDRHVLPLSGKIARIVVIGGHADVGVISGGGSSQVLPVGGPALTVPAPKDAPSFAHNILFDPSSPLDAIKGLTPGAFVTFLSGDDPEAAAAAAKGADVAIVFATQWMSEERDVPTLSLADGQDALIDAVAHVNKRTVVVLETGGPVLMPWLPRVAAVMEAWYPGQRGGQAIANILFGQASPSGRLPITFPSGPDQLPRPSIPGFELPRPAFPGGPETPFSVQYTEGANVGYRWFDARHLKPLFPFGFGLGLTDFAYSGLKLTGGKTVTAEFDVENTGARAGTDTPQLYATVAVHGAGPVRRLIGWSRVTLSPGESRHVSVTADPRLLATFDNGVRAWRIVEGKVGVVLARDAAGTDLSGSVALDANTIAP